jgi:hypothetical protein
MLWFDHVQDIEYFEEAQKFKNNKKKLITPAAMFWLWCQEYNTVRVKFGIIMTGLIENNYFFFFKNIMLNLKLPFSIIINNGVRGLQISKDVSSCYVQLIAFSKWIIENNFYNLANWLIAGINILCKLLHHFLKICQINWNFYLQTRRSFRSVRRKIILYNFSWFSF